MIDGASEPLPAMTDAVRVMDRVEAILRGDARLSGDRCTRPHPLLAAMWRTLVVPEAEEEERSCVVFAPAVACEGERDVLADFIDRFADGSALLVMVGYPINPLPACVHQGLASVVDDSARSEDIYIAARTAFNLLEAKARADA